MRHVFPLPAPLTGIFFPLARFAQHRMKKKGEGKKRKEQKKNISDPILTSSS